MARVRVVLILLLLTTGCVGRVASPSSAPPALRGSIVVAQSGRFSVWMPEDPELFGEAEEVSIGGTDVTCYQYFARTSGVYWLARYCNLPVGVAGPSTQPHVIDAAQTFLLQEAQGRITAVEEVLVEAVPARRIFADSALRAGEFDGEYRALIVVQSDRLYLISTYGHNAAEPADLDTMERFLSSFRFLPE